MYDENINKKFGRVIAKLRYELHLSQEELAYRCGMHRTYIGAIERGEKSPTLTTIYKISLGLNTPINKIWEALVID